jgi:hypothetical protein
MAIVSTRELARTFENEVGSTGGKARRRWVCSLSDDTLTGGALPTLAEIATATSGDSFGAYHPTHTLLRLLKISLNERFEDDPYKLEVIGEYGLVTADELAIPWQRAAVWSFESRPGEVPALYYYDGDGNALANQRPLTNSAYDFFPGLTTDESLVRVKIQQNYQAYPSGWLQAQNCVNAGEFLGCPADSVKVAAVEATYTTEMVSNVMYAFYASTATLEYRQSGHVLRLPDVGYNFIDSVSGQKRRGMVFDFQNSEWVPSPNPVPLNGEGGQVLNGPPSILPRRVNPRANFTALFGSPP